MSIILENHLLTATIKEDGAELTSLRSKETGIDYIWNGNPKFWNRHSPVLFPIVGRLKGDCYFANEREYKLGQHGFARDMVFECREQKKDFVKLALTYSEVTLEKYPYKFELAISYYLKETSLEVFWEVVNLDEQKIYFGIGGHPAFNIPIDNELTFEDYYIDVNPKGCYTRIPLVPPLLDTKNKYSETVDKIALTHGLFENDALVYETKGACSFTLKTDKSERALTLSYENIPYVGFWSPYPVKAPFVCIEPWCSHADTTETNGHFDEKESIQSLEVGEKFNTHYRISVK